MRQECPECGNVFPATAGDARAVMHAGIAN